MHVYNSHRGQLGLHLPNKLLVDNFAGGGGASIAMEMAFGRPVDIAINHDPEAISMHKVNHPDTEHYCESVWDVDIIKACKGREVEWVHSSPDCKHHSKARGGKPMDKNIRGLAWIVPKWGLLKEPDNLSLENVEEFKSWGPLLPGGHACPDSKGVTFKAFQLALTTGIKPNQTICRMPGLATNYSPWREAVVAMGIEHNTKLKLKLSKGLNYSIDWNEVVACKNNAPTTRKRLFMFAKKDGSKICWAKPTHGKPNSLEVQSGKLKPYRTAAECIDWSVPVRSIFNRKRPLAEKTMQRIARGLKKFVIDNPNPFIAPVEAAPFITECANASNQRNMPIDEPLRTITAQTKGGTFALVTAFLAKHYGGNYTGAGINLTNPVDTITTTDHHALVTSHLLKLRNNCTGSPTDEPVPTITAGGLHIGEVRAFLLKYYGNEKDGLGVDEPLHTITTNDRFGLVTVKGVDYQIVDIGMRMLEPHELYAAQSFPPGYIHDRTSDGKKLSKKAQVRMCGNSVAPEPFAALIRANINKESKEQEQAA
jgi:DNA (cytosine-5)-methyltransferase 1